MTESTLHRDRENFFTNKRLQNASNLLPQRQNIRASIEDRILKETQSGPQTSNANLKAHQLFNQEYSGVSNFSNQYDKATAVNMFNKSNDKDIGQILRENLSPTASVGTNDISYRIFNEILNTHSEDRGQYKLKMNPRVAERKKSPMNKVQQSTESVKEMLNNQAGKEAQAMFEENKELKKLQDKINEIKEVLGNKLEMIETCKIRYEAESQELE